MSLLDFFLFSTYSVPKETLQILFLKEDKTASSIFQTQAKMLNLKVLKLCESLHGSCHTRDLNKSCIFVEIFFQLKLSSLILVNRQCCQLQLLFHFWFDSSCRFGMWTVGSFHKRLLCTVDPSRKQVKDHQSKCRFFNSTESTLPIFLRLEIKDLLLVNTNVNLVFSQSVGEVLIDFWLNSLVFVNSFQMGKQINGEVWNQVWFK